MRRLWHEASQRLRGKRRSAAVLGAARLTVFLFCLFCGSIVQRLLLCADTFTAGPNRWDLFLLCVPAASLLFVTPLRMQTAWQLGLLSGLLDENDNGFLSGSSALWLWARAIIVRLLSGICLIVSAAPALVLLMAAKGVWLTIPPEQESLLPLLTVLHLAMLTAAAVWLPLRVFAACTALPYCFLKMPHVPAVRVLVLSFRLTAGQTFSVVLMRLLSLPALICPFSAVWVLPTLLTAEQLRASRSWRHMQPRRTGRFSRLELHAV
ncbi:MAG: hypothetical protein IKQ39_00485 [Oscillospiraceae bacterium]|nr:hypothetical protein [Oscillospiraceae bacterium]